MGGRAATRRTATRRTASGGEGTDDPAGEALLLEVVRLASSTSEWVDAIPFRAHLLHLVGVSGLPWPVIAALAGVSTSAARSLLFGRRGRALRRICPEVAGRLLQLTPSRLRWARTDLVPAAASVELARRLATGLSLAELAARSGVPVAELAELLAEEPPARCPELTAARLRTLDVEAEDAWAA